MTQTYKDNKTGREIDINIYGNEYLAKITMGLWSKMGFCPRSSEDCIIVARILKNHIKYQEEYRDSPAFEYYGIRKEHPEFIIFMKEVANFFEHASEGISFPDIDFINKKKEGKKEK